MLIVFFGSPMVDVIAQVDENFLRRYHLMPDGSTKISDNNKEVFNEILNHKPVIQAGGSVTNTVRIFNWISKNLPSPTKCVYVGAIGTDHDGKTIKKILKEENVDYSFVEVENEPTGKCAVLVSGKCRSLVTYLGASSSFGIEYYWKYGNHLVQEADFLYISALFIGVSMEVIKVTFQYFSQKHKKIIINLGAPFLCQTNPEDVIFMFRNANVVFGNKMEFEAFAKISEANCNTNLRETLLNIQQKYPETNRLLISTSGPEPVFILENNEINRFEVENIENIVDTNGAGDAFVGGFLAKFVENEGLEECVQCGLWCAKHVIQNIGCKFNSKLLYTSAVVI